MITVSKRVAFSFSPFCFTLRRILCGGGILLAAAVMLAKDCSAEWRVPPSAEKFRVPNDGRFITIPVTVNHRDWDFLIDTGCSVTIVDELLRPDMKEYVTQTKLPNGRRVDLYRGTEFHVGASLLKPNGGVGCADLNSIRKVTRLPVYGILGMDCLRHLVLHLDFARGDGFVCSDFKAMGDPVGESLPLEYTKGGIPMLALGYGNDVKLSHEIDTGCPRNGLIPKEAAEQLESANLATDLGISRQSDVLGLSSRMHHRFLRVAEVAVGRIRLKNIVIDAPAEADDPGNSLKPMLGLYFLRRFTCTFSFPENKLWLSPITPDERHDHSDMDGIVVGKFKNGNLVVISVAPTSVALAAGVAKGDIITAIDGRSTLGWEVSHSWEIIEADRSRPLELNILRNEQELKIALPQ